MKLDAVNRNYAAVVVQITAINQLQADGAGKKDCDNVVGTPLLGFQAIVDKGTKVGDIGIVFPAETQLSETYASSNNLFREPELNVDPLATGYLEKHRRIKALKFRGHRSDALYMPLSSLTFIEGIDLSKFKVGDVFDTINGTEICRKYVVKVPESRVQKNKQAAKERRVDEKFLPKHFDTDNWFRNKDAIPAGTELIITAKLHGTSVRLGNVPVKRELKWYERLAKRFGVKVQEWEYDYIAGSRRVIKDPKDNDHNHFYDHDVWTASIKHVEGALPQGYIVYGELIGWVGDKPIQPNYTYNIPQGVDALYVYRVAHVGPDGFAVDLSWDQVKEFCKDRGLLHVPEIYRCTRVEMDEYEDYNPETYLDIKFNESWPGCPPLSHPETVDEGVCIRVEGLVPYILKAKSPAFYLHESKMLDKEVVDIESVE